MNQILQTYRHTGAGMIPCAFSRGPWVRLEDAQRAIKEVQQACCKCKACKKAKGND